MKKWTQNWTTPLRVLLAGAGISAVAFMAPMVISAPPPANAVIGNQASATYIDLAGKNQQVQSNLVTTTVAQVAGVDMQTSNDKSALVGNTVYMPHSLLNSGNGTDVFRIEVDPSGPTSQYTNVAIYPDANGTGVPSSTTPLCSDAGTTKCTDGFLQSLPAGEKFNFVVAYTVPTSATPGVVDTTTVKATSQLNTTVSDSVTDKITVVTGAVFAATKAVKVPGVAAAAGTWPAAVSVGKPSPADCPTAWVAGLPASRTDCNYTTYTVNFKNNGGDVGVFTMQDKLPVGLTYVTGSAIFSGAGGNALPDTTTPATEGSVTSSYTPAPALDTVTSGTFKASVTGVGVNVSGSISFVVLINSKATSADNDVSTTNFANYWSTSCNPALAASTTSPTNCVPPAGSSTAPGDLPPVLTNPASIPVADTYGVVAADNATDKTPDGGVPTNKTTDDANLIIKPTAQPGETVKFENYVSNIGGNTDVFNITVPAVGTVNNNYPVGTTFAFYKADGFTPLTDTNNDGIVDTGPVAPGAPAVKVFMTATLPTNAPISTTDLNALFTATSSKDPSKVDYVWNQVSAIVAPTSLVDLTNTPLGGQISTGGGVPTGPCTAGVNCDQGQGPSASPTFTDTTTPGVTVDFPVYIDNNTGASGTFDLKVPSLPPGWTATFTEGATCPGTPITSVTLASGEQDKAVLACITPPPGTPAGTTNVDIVVTKNGDPTVTDTLRDAVTVVDPTAKPNMQLGPDIGSPKVNAGGTVDQPTTLTNTGTTSCGAGGNGFKATLTVTGTTPNWAATLYYDANANGVVDQGDVAQTTLATVGTPNVFKLTNATLSGTAAGVPAHPIPLAPGMKLPLLVKIFAPEGSTKGEIGTAKLILEDTNPTAAEACPSDSAEFNASVLVGQVRVVKKQAYLPLNTDCSTAAAVAAVPTAFVAEAVNISPSPLASVKQCIVYKVVATNEGDAPVKAVKLSDVVPAYTNYAVDAGQQPAVQCSTTATSNAVAFATVPAVPTVDTKELSCGTVNELQPGGTLTMMFTVMLQK